jgi:hypothetical protein
MILYWVEGGRVHTVKKNLEALVVASKGIRLEVNVDKTKYMVTSRDQNEVPSHNIKIDNASFERVESSNICKQSQHIKILFRKKLRTDWSGNACYHSVQNLFVF